MFRVSRRLRVALTHSGPGYDLPSQFEADLRASFGALAERYEEIADRATTDTGKARALQIGQAARDIRKVLATGQLPARFMTDDELRAAYPGDDAEIEEEAS